MKNMAREFCPGRCLHLNVYPFGHPVIQELRSDGLTPDKVYPFGHPVMQELRLGGLMPDKV